MLWNLVRFWFNFNENIQCILTVRDLIFWHICLLPGNVCYCYIDKKININRRLANGWYQRDLFVFQYARRGGLWNCDFVSVSISNKKNIFYLLPSCWYYCPTSTYERQWKLAPLKTSGSRRQFIKELNTQLLAIRDV